MNKRMSVVIVTWNSSEHIENCLRSLCGTVGGGIEILVVDNRSTDSTTEIVRRFPEVELIETGANLGFAPAMNIGIRRASGPLICLLNPDTTVSPTALDYLEQFLVQNPSVVAAGPRQVDEHGKTVRAGARPLPSLWEAFARQFGIAKLLPEALLVGSQVHVALSSEAPTCVPALSGAALVLRKTLIDEVGLLDETIPMYFEDLDYCARLRKKGPICYLPQAAIVHRGGQSADIAPARWLLYAMEDGEAPWLYFRRYRSKASSFAFLVLIFAGSLFRLALLLPARVVSLFFSRRTRAKLGCIRTRSAALLRWSVCPGSQFEEQMNRFFRRNPTATVHRCDLDAVISKGGSAS